MVVSTELSISFVEKIDNVRMFKRAWSTDKNFFLSLTQPTSLRLHDLSHRHNKAAQKQKPEPRTVLYIIQLNQKPSRCIAALQPWHQVSKIVQFTPNSRCAPSRRGSTCATTTTALPQIAVPQHQMSIFYTRAAALFLLHFARRHEPVIIRHHQLHSAASAVLASWLERREPSIAVAIFKTSGSLPSRYHVNFSQH